MFEVILNVQGELPMSAYARALKRGETVYEFELERHCREFCNELEQMHNIPIPSTKTWYECAKVMVENVPGKFDRETLKAQLVQICRYAEEVQREAEEEVLAQERRLRGL